MNQKQLYEQAHPMPFDRIVDELSAAAIEARAYSGELLPPGQWLDKYRAGVPQSSLRDHLTMFYQRIDDDTYELMGTLHTEHLKLCMMFEKVVAKPGEADSSLQLNMTGDWVMVTYHRRGASPVQWARLRRPEDYDEYTIESFR